MNRKTRSLLNRQNKGDKDGDKGDKGTVSGRRQGTVLCLVSTTVISVTIDTIISIFVTKWVSITLKGLLKTLLKLYFGKGSKKGIQIAKQILHWLTKNKLGIAVAKILLSVLAGIVLGFVGFKTPAKAAIDGVVNSCIQSVLTIENKLVMRISSLISAFSSVGGFFAFFLDICDFDWDDYWTPANNTVRIVGVRPIRC